jgi:hypothetical protein
MYAQIILQMFCDIPPVALDSHSYTWMDHVYLSQPRTRLLHLPKLQFDLVSYKKIWIYNNFYPNPLEFLQNIRDIHTHFGEDPMYH